MPSKKTNTLRRGLVFYVAELFKKARPFLISLISSIKKTFQLCSRYAKKKARPLMRKIRPVIIRIVSKARPFIEWIKVRQRKLVRVAILAIIFSIPAGYFISKNIRGVLAAPWSLNHSTYNQRKRLDLINSSGQTFESGTTYKITVDTQSLVGENKLLSTCDDLKIVYQPDDDTAVELKRNIEYASGTTCSTSSASQVVFQLQSNISDGDIDSDYYIYYGDENADSYSQADARAAYNIGSADAIFVAPFNGTTTALAAGSGTPSSASGAIRFDEGKTALLFDGSNDYVDIGTVGETTPEGTFIQVEQSGVTSHSSIASASILTWSHTVTESDDNTQLVVSVAVGGDFTGGTPVTGITYDGEALTYLGRSGPRMSVELWALQNPSVGTADIVVTMENSVYAIMAGANNWINVDATDPFGDYTHLEGYATNVSYTVPSADLGVVVDVVSITRSQPTPDSGQTFQWYDPCLQYPDYGAGSSKNSSSATTTMIWNFANSTYDYNLGAVSLNPMESSGNNKTIEFWVNPASSDTALFELTDGRYANISGGVITISGIANEVVYVNGVETTSISANTWSHVAIVMENGVEIPSLKIGTANGSYFSGMIDEFRISETVRYNHEFYPTRSPFIRDDATALLIHMDENGDDVRNSGKTLDDSKNNYDGTIYGANFAAGIAGVNDASYSRQANHSYSSHRGVFLEEGTTNKITNPSFENSSYNTNWSLESTPVFEYDSTEDTFTAAIARRNSAGPFASGVMLQGILDDDTVRPDYVEIPIGSNVSGLFYSNIDYRQGTMVFWVTPEEIPNTNRYLFDGRYNGHPTAWMTPTGIYFGMDPGVTNLVANAPVTWVVGRTYQVIFSWDAVNDIEGTNNVRVSVNDTHSYGGNGNGSLPRTDDLITLGVDRWQSVIDCSANALIEGFTIYRRVLWDGTYGTDTGNGDEIHKINNGGSHTGSDNASTLTDSARYETRYWSTNELVGGTVVNQTDGSSGTITSNTSTTITATLSGGTDNDWDTGDEYIVTSVSGVDPTLITGSWDVVFSMPTNASPGTLNGGTGNAWTHPHRSNMLGGSNGRDGFMMSGTLASDGWTSLGVGATEPTFSSLDNSEKIFAGGYKWTNNTANQGIYIDIGVTAGADVVIRGLAHSDGTAVPSIILYDQTNDEEIGHFTGTSSSTRGDPDTLVFTGEAPDGYARGSISIDGQPSDSQTVTIDSAVYTFKTDISGTPGAGEIWVYIGASYSATAENLDRAIDDAGTQGTNYKYGSGAGAHSTVSAFSYCGYGGSPACNVLITSDSTGSGGNSIALSETADNTTVSGSNLTGGKTPCTTLRLKLVNTESSGTSYWHQVEVLRTYYSNPSMETSNNPNPWSPDGWYPIYPNTDDYIKETTAPHSGLSAFRYNNVTGNEQVMTNENVNVTTGSFGVMGGFMRTSGYSYRMGQGDDNPSQAAYSGNLTLFSSSTNWTHKAGIFRQADSAVETRASLGLDHSTAGQYGIYDDIYMFSLPNVSLTTVPASEVYSTEPTGIRVDGADTLTQTIDTITTTSGQIIFKITPRHSWSTATSFGTTSPVLATFYSSANDYIKVYRYSTNAIRIEGVFNGTTIAANSITAPTLDAETSYDIAVSYNQNSNLQLFIDDDLIASTTMASNAFGTAPTTAFWGSDNNGANQYDATITESDMQAAALSENTSTEYVKYGDNSAKVTESNGLSSLVTSIDVGNTNPHTLSAYVYDGSSGSMGSGISSSTASLVFNGSAQTTTYTDMGGGWWRLSYTGTPGESSQDYGVQIQPGKTVYVDGVQLEELTYTTSYTDGSLGDGYSWSGTENNSTSSRAISNLTYEKTNNVDPAKGSISFWFKPSWEEDIVSGSSAVHIFSTGSHRMTWSNTSVWVNTDTLEAKIVDSSGNSIKVSWNSSSWNEKEWQHIVFTWNDSSNEITGYWNGISGTPSVDGGFASPIFGTLIRLGGSSSTNIDGVQYSDFRIYNDVLTSTQSIDLYYSGLGSHMTDEVPTQRFSSLDPVLAWHMDEGYGTVAHDSTLQLNHGNISGPSWSVDSMGGGPSSKSLEFDGTDDYIYREYTGDSELNPSTRPFAVSTWFKHSTTVPSTQTLISRYNTAGYKLYMNTSGYICFGIDDDITWGPDDSVCTTTSYADNEWHHVQAIKGTSNIEIYIDGDQKGTTAITATGSLSGWYQTFYVGIDSDGESDPWEGLIDEVRVYNESRTSDEVLEEYIARGSNIGVSAQLGSEAYLSKGLVGYWKMDEESWDGTTDEVIDSSGYENHGTAMPSGSEPTTGVGKFDSGGGDFDGTNDYIATDFMGALPEGDEPYTISLWVKPTTAVNSELWENIAISWGQHGSPYTDTALAIREDQIEWQTWGDETSTINGDFMDQWTHVTLTYDSESIKIFTNGDLATSKTLDYDMLLDDNTKIIIGDRDGTSADITPPLGRNFTGDIDEVRVYNRALSPAEIRAIYDWAPGPVAHWRMDEGSGSAISDSSGNGNTGTLYNMGLSSWEPGKFGNALHFDGVGADDDYIDAGSNDLVDNLHDGAMTFSAWVKAERGGEDNGAYIASKIEGGGGWKIGYHTGGNLEVLMYCDNQIGDFVTTSYTSSDYEWTHVAFTYDESTNGYANIYINGVKVESDVTNIECLGSATLDSSNTLYLGARNTTDSTWIGLLDDVKIYNYARTPEQIISDMNASHPAPGSPVGSALLHLKFDEGYGDTAHNSGNGGSSYSGNLGGASSCPDSAVCPTWTNSGKFSKSLSFDGVDDYVSVQDSTGISFGNGSKDEPFTISVWVNMIDAETFQPIIYKGPVEAVPAGLEWTVYVEENKLNFWLYDDEGNDNIGVSSTPDIEENKWIYVTATYDGSGSIDGMNLYVDGKHMTTSSSAEGDYSAIHDTNNPLYIGTFTPEDETWGGFLSGLVDEPKIYNFALSADQVITEYNQGMSQIMGSLGTDSSGNASNASDRSYCPPGNYEGNCASGSDPSPVVEWNFDENTGQYAQDISENSNTGMLGSSSSADSSDPVWVSGRYGSALEFDGANDYVDVGTGNDLNLYNTDFTIEAWVNLDNYNSSHTSEILNRWGGSPTSGYEFAVHGETQNEGEVKLVHWNGGVADVVESNSTLPLGSWHHVAVTYDLSATTATIYIDGAIDRVDTSSIAQSDAGSLEANIGIRSGGVTYAWDGKMDSVQVYKYIRTPSQIAWDYNKGAPVLHYKLDECSGPVAHNSGGEAETRSMYDANISIGTSGAQTSLGSCQSGETDEAWNNGTSGKLNSSMSFDGTDDYIELDTELNTQDWQEISASAWFKPDATGGSTIVSKWDIDDSGFGSSTFSLYQSNSQICFGVSIESPQSVTISCSASGVISTGTWYHVTGTYDGENVKVYLDGVLVKSDAETGTLGNPSTNVFVGAAYDTSSGYNSEFDGQIDDVRVYNYALTPEQIKLIMNSGAVRFD